jgi:hypothetical protein
MPIHTYAVGAHLKVHSFNATAPSQRPNPPAPSCLIVICHGIYLETTATIQLAPHLPDVRFSVEHGEPRDVDIKWFQDLITEGVASALEYDFKYQVNPNDTIVNYHLGKGEPSRGKGDTPAQMLSYDKNDRIPWQNPKNTENGTRGSLAKYDAKKIYQTNVLSSSYVQNIMLFAESKRKGDQFDFATVKKSCRELQDVFNSYLAMPRPNYDHLLLGFCRETVGD